VLYTILDKDKGKNKNNGTVVILPQK
jgi:hypothetical protein